MKHLTQPNRWSCLATSFAMATACRTVQEFLDDIGHDGSARVNDGPEPLCRRTFHVQECIWAAWKRGYSVTEFEVAPQLAAGPKWPPIDVPRNYNLDSLLMAHSGVLIGDGKINRHAVAFDEGCILDPNGFMWDDFENQQALSCIYSIYVVKLI